MKHADNIELFRSMLRIRRVQEKIEKDYLQDEMKTPVHLYIGQEAVAAGVCATLRPQDYISSNHRSHGHYLAKGGNLKALIAELHCREGGCSRGYGGSMHVVDPAVGHLGSSSIVGGGIPIGTGLALAARMQGQDRISVVFFGDGAADEGVWYESVNFAMLKRLPVVYVLENNQYSVCSPVSARQAGTNIFHAADADLLLTQRVDGNDVLAVYEAARQSVDRARSGAGPAFIECETYRILGHAGCAVQDAKGYRDPAEVAAWRSRCPVATFRRRLQEAGALTDRTLAVMESQIADEIAEAFSFAQACPLPDVRQMNHFLFRE